MKIKTHYTLISVFIITIIITSILLSFGSGLSISKLNKQVEYLRWENSRIKDLLNDVMYELKSNKSRDVYLNNVLKSTNQLINYSIERGFIVQETSSYYTGKLEQYEQLMNKFLEALRGGK